MNIDPVLVAEWALMIVGGATIAFRAIAPLTESKWDNKVLQFLEKILEYVSLNKSEHESKLEIKLKR